jgi:hypothetical protein
MRKGILGSIAALAAGAATAWGQGPMPLPPAGGPPAAFAPGAMPPGPVAFPGPEAGGVSGPNPVIMPPVTVGPPGDPLGLGPTASLGPPPGPMYPPPGPYGAPLFQPPPPGQGAGGFGSGYGTAPRWWFSGEYLLWTAKGQPVDFPLLTTSAPDQFGLLNFPSTIQLVPADDISYNAISGFRLNGGFFGDADRRFGLDVSGFYTQLKTINQFFSTSPGGPNDIGVGPDVITNVGLPLLARPFIDTTTGPRSLVVTNLQQGVGSAHIGTSTSTWGAEASAVWNLYRSAPGTRFWWSLDFLAGYRFLQIKEDFVIQSFTTLNAVQTIPIVQTGPFGTPIFIGFRVVPIPFPVGGTFTGAPASIQVIDRFTATNRFNGASFGLRHELRCGMFTVTTIGKLGIGNMHQVLEIEGATTFANPNTGRAGSSYGGLFANASNIGRFNNDEFAVIPELTMNFGINVTRQLNMFVGYNFLYANKVARPGAQINPIVDASTVPLSSTYGDLGQVPGTRQLFVQDEFWLMGVNFGMVFKY